MHKRRTLLLAIVVSIWVSVLPVQAFALANIKAPTNLKATTPNEITIDLAWSDNADNEKYYWVFWLVDGTLFEQKLPANTKAFSIPKVKAGKTYRITVYAAGDGAQGSQRIFATATTPTFLKPTNFKGALSGGKVTATFKDNSAIEGGYQIIVTNGGKTQALPASATGTTITLSKGMNILTLKAIPSNAIPSNALPTLLTADTKLTFAVN
jgi:hypothetical protein